MRQVVLAAPVPQPNMTTMKPAIFLLLGVLCSGNAYAYLDPASGNALVSFLLALFGSAVFVLKSLFYKVFTQSSAEGRIDQGSGEERAMPLIFAEGRTYWTTFRPIVEELIRQKVHFRYVTLDVHDPGLTIDSEYMHSRRYAKTRLGFARMANLAAPVMLSTTPNIGSPGYPLARPAGVVKLVHVFHALVDVSCYRKGSLDFYDAVLMAAAHEETAIRQVEKARNLKPKELVAAGLPCLDDLNRQKLQIEQAAKQEKTRVTVLVAPSWGPKGCFSEYGTDFVQTLAAADYRVIVRLHPHSRIFEPESVETWRAQTRALENVVWDDNPFGAQAMGQADILISDASSIRFDFAFLYERPVISLPIARESRSIFESDYMPETWADTVSGQIGVIAKPEQLAAIDQLVAEAMDIFTPGKLGQLREQYIANFGNSAAVIAGYLRRQAEMLSTTPGERSLAEQVAAPEDEMTDLRDQLNQAQSNGFKATSE